MMGKASSSQVMELQAFSTRLEAPEQATVAGSWEIPEETAGGDYRLQVSYPGTR